MSLEKKKLSLALRRSTGWIIDTCYEIKLTIKGRGKKKRKKRV